MLTLETTYYIIGIVAMILWIIVAIAAAVLAFQIRNKVQNFQAGFGGKLAALLQERNKEAAAAVGLAFARFFVDKLRKKARR